LFKPNKANLSVHDYTEKLKCLMTQNSNDMIFIKNLQEERLITRNGNNIKAGKAATLLIGNNSDDLI